MSLVPKGVAVKIKRSIRGITWDHSFEEDDIAVSLGKDFGEHSRGTWSLFRNQDGDTQYLLPEHYTVLDSPVTAKPVDFIVEQTQSVKVEKAKAVYAVVDANDDVKATTADRDLARDFKAALGGKRLGVRILQYNNAKEIR
ncbi:hypothetical protein PHB09_087 [Pseudomonas phage PHB09]|uniref:Uncharacterized protein n=1 Tax=Pseudomonas phage PHB09 TaxID=2867265 RepID=A0AAE9BMR8_9CAUD|nr:hypothetical protein QGX10_gp087 [Pseudomonas phage PHB09]UAV84583.1 hypothetical protein PHB09_087 [Pseudomonas phage PHB09]